MIRLLATDLDGTLLYPKNRLLGIPGKNRRFLKDLFSRNIDVVYVSGRNTAFVPYLRRLGHPVSLLGCNGAYLYQDGILRDTHPMDRTKLLRLILELSGRYGIFAFFLFDEKEPLYVFFQNLPTPYILSLLVGNRLNGAYREKLIVGKEAFFDKVQNSDNYKLMLTFGIGEEAKRRARNAYLSVSDIARGDFRVAVSGSSLEITAEGVDKGVGLLEYCRKNGIDPSEVLVVGDSGNDIPMFERFTHSFAMERAPSFVKEKANHVVPSVHDLQKYVEDDRLLSGDR